jgi:hypothetical protein
MLVIPAEFNASSHADPGFASTSSAQVTGMKGEEYLSKYEEIRKSTLCMQARSARMIRVFC